MAKEEILLKFKLKDYNNELEKVLEGKNFSSYAKNLLLSMLYKIETSYADYSRIKVVVEKKNDFIEKIISNIDNNCDEIIIINPQSEESKKLEENKKSFIVDRQNKKIEAYPNERAMMSAICKISEKKIYINEKHKIIKNSIINFIEIANVMNQVEVIRDFNGWSWSSMVEEIEDTFYNIIYQNIQILLGVNFLNEWINDNDSVVDYVENLEIELEELYGKELAKKFLNAYYKALVNIYISYDNKEKGFIEEIGKSIKEKLNILNNKEKYLDELSKEKKEYFKKIYEIDKIINDKQLLEKEFKEQNKKLGDNEKIFSMSYLVDILNNEKIELLDNIQKITRKMEPKNFIREIDKIKNDLTLIDNLKLNERIELSDIVIELQKAFIECLKNKIQKIDNKKEIIELIYIIRYYNLLLFEEKISIKDVSKLRIKLQNLEKALIKKGNMLNAIIKISNDEQINFKMLRPILKVRTLELEGIEILLAKNEEKISIEYYDGETLETKEKMDLDKDKNEINIKIGKKIKIFL